MNKEDEAVVGEKTIIMVIPTAEFRDEELFEVKNILEEAGVRVKIGALKQTTIIGMLGGTIQADIGLYEIKVTEIDGLVFVGGNGAQTFWSDPFCHKIITDMLGYEKIIAATSNAVVTLANAYALVKKKATCSKNEQALIVAKGAMYSAARVEYDGKIITCNGPEAAEQFGRSLLKEIQTT